MSDDQRPPKRRKSAAQVFLGMIGLGGGNENLASVSADPIANSAPSQELAVNDMASEDTSLATSPVVGGREAKANSGDGGGGGFSPSSKTRCPSKQMLQETARSALLALSDAPPSAAPPGVVGMAPRKSKGKGKDKGTGSLKHGEKEVLGVVRKGVSVGSVTVKAELVVGSGVLTGLPEWTESEALGSLRYNKKPLMTMLVADLREALETLSLSPAGSKPELRLRLARRLYSDIAAGYTSVATVKGFEVLAPPISTEGASEMSSARGARHQKRRVSLAITSLCKGPNTKDKPIVVSSSDDEDDAGAAVVNPPSTAVANTAPNEDEDGTSTAAGCTEISVFGRASGRSGKRTRLMRYAKDPAVAKETRINADAPAGEITAGPKPGMTLAELRRGVKALGLKPKGTRKADLEACWRDAVSITTKEEHKEEDVEGTKVGGQGGKIGEQATEEAEALLGGVRVLNMKVFTLKKHVQEMSLKPAGHLKVDLQRCLCEALRIGHSGKGRHAPNRAGGRDAAKEGNSSDSGDGRAADVSGRQRRGRRGVSASQGAQVAVSPTSVRRGRRAHTKQAEPSPGFGCSPDRIRFHGKAVSAMKPDERRKSLHDLDMPSKRMDDEETTHDLVDALIQRKAEAAEMNSRKQAWCGRLVHMMRKAELADMLRDFNADDSGKVEDMRVRFRKELRKWAASEVEVPNSADGAGGSNLKEGVKQAEADPGSGSDENAADPENESSSTEAKPSGKGRGRPTLRSQAKKAATLPSPKGRRKTRAKPASGGESSTSESRRGVSSSSRIGIGKESIEGSSSRPRRSRAVDDKKVTVSPEKTINRATAAKGKGKGRTSKAESKLIPAEPASARSSSRSRRVGADSQPGRSELEDGEEDDDGNTPAPSATHRPAGRPPRRTRIKSATASPAKGKGRGEEKTKATASPERRPARVSLPSPTTAVRRRRAATGKTAPAVGSSATPSSLGDKEVGYHSSVEFMSETSNMESTAEAVPNLSSKIGPLPSEVIQPTDVIMEDANGDAEGDQSSKGKSPGRDSPQQLTGDPPSPFSRGPLQRERGQGVQAQSGEVPQGSPGFTGSNSHSEYPARNGDGGQGSGFDGDGGSEDEGGNGLGSRDVGGGEGDGNGGNDSDSNNSEGSTDDEEARDEQDDIDEQEEEEGLEDEDELDADIAKNASAEESQGGADSGAVEGAEDEQDDDPKQRSQGVERNGIEAVASEWKGQESAIETRLPVGISGALNNDKPQAVVGRKPSTENPATGFSDHPGDVETLKAIHVGEGGRNEKGAGLVDVEQEAMQIDDAIVAEPALLLLDGNESHDAEETEDSEVLLFIDQDSVAGESEAVVSENQEKAFLEKQGREIGSGCQQNLEEEEGEGDTAEEDGVEEEDTVEEDGVEEEDTVEEGDNVEEGDDMEEGEAIEKQQECDGEVVDAQDDDKTRPEKVAEGRGPRRQEEEATEAKEDTGEEVSADQIDCQAGREEELQGDTEGIGVSTDMGDVQDIGQGLVEELGSVDGDGFDDDVEDEVEGDDDDEQDRVSTDVESDNVDNNQPQGISSDGDSSSDVQMQQQQQQPGDGNEVNLTEESGEVNFAEEDSAERSFLGSGMQLQESASTEIEMEGDGFEEEHDEGQENEGDGVEGEEGGENEWEGEEAEKGVEMLLSSAQEGDEAVEFAEEQEQGQEERDGELDEDNEEEIERGYEYYEEGGEELEEGQDEDEGEYEGAEQVEGAGRGAEIGVAPGGGTGDFAIEIGDSSDEDEVEHVAPLQDVEQDIEEQHDTDDEVSNGKNSVSSDQDKSNSPGYEIADSAESGQKLLGFGIFEPQKNVEFSNFTRVQSLDGEGTVGAEGPPEENTGIAPVSSDGAQIVLLESQGPAEVQAQVSFAGVETAPSSSSSAVQEAREDREGSEEPLESNNRTMEQFKALLGKIGYEGKREAINFLADPTVRPVDPSLPALNGNQEARLLSCTRSVHDWDEALILTLNNFVESAREAFRPPGVTASGPNVEWPSIRDVVPSMRGGAQPSNSRFPASHPPTLSRPYPGSAFTSLAHDEGADGSDGRQMVGARRDFDDDDSEDSEKLAMKRQRLDEQGRGAMVTLPPAPGFGMLPGAPIDSNSRSGAGMLAGGGSTLVSRDRRRSSSSVLKYRSKDFTPRRRPRVSLLEEQHRHAGHLGVLLGEAREGVRSDARGDANSVGLEQRGDAARRRLVGQTEQDGIGGKAFGMGESSRHAASSLGLEGMDATPRKSRNRNSLEVARKEASRVAAVTKATAEVGSLLLSIVSEGGRGDTGRDVKKQVLEEQALRSDRQAEHERRKNEETKQAAEEQIGRRRKLEKGRAEDMSTCTPASLIAKLPVSCHDQSGSEFVFRVAPSVTRRQKLLGNDDFANGGDGVSIGSSNSASDAEFIFASQPPRRIGPARCAHSFIFARATPAKRSRSCRDEGSDVLALAPQNHDEADVDASESFEFLISTSRPHRVRRRIAVGRSTSAGISREMDVSAVASMAPPTVASLDVAITSDFGSSGGCSASGTSRAPITNGFDMSKFKKPGEWKCEFCLVKNPPGRNKCLSCEALKPGASGSEGGVGMGQDCSLSVSEFTFGVQTGAGGGGGISSEVATVARGSGSKAAPAPMTNVFDLSKFKKPGEWKCESCLVKNPPGGEMCLACETPKPGASGAASKTAPSGGILAGLSSSSTPSFIFGQQPPVAGAVTSSTFAAPSSSAPFTFGGTTVAAGSDAKPSTVPVTGGFDMSKFKKPGEWKCDSCLVKNGPEQAKCLSCETPKPGGATATAMAGHGGGQTSLPSSTGGAIFGFGGEGVSSTSITGSSSALRGGFKFGASLASAAAPTASSSVAPAAGGFVLGAPAPPSAIVSSSAPINSATGFSFGGSVSGSGGSTPASPAPSNTGTTIGGSASIASFGAAGGFGFGTVPPPAPANSNRTATPIFSFGAGSLPAPANLNSTDNSNESPFSFGAGTGIGTPAAGASASPFMFGGFQNPTPPK